MGNILRSDGSRWRVPILAVLKPLTAVRFKARLRQEGECLVFMGTKNARGYGFVDVMTAEVRTPILTHRLAWALHYGADPDPELIVCHRCNNPKCCNVEHLYLGTHQDNADDKVRAGTARGGMLGVKGAAHPRAHPQKTRDWLVAHIKASLAAGLGLNYTAAAREFGVTRQTAERWWRERTTIL